ncbi:MAG: DNA/RNA non-specific endonuclease [Symploca sp. SIO2C1]|nr:DNA/RNA non-specific endonuclease [Symploca sp. SIO2C1]
MEKPQYALSYSQERGTPNWVAWQLSSKWLGDAERQDDFRSDESLPSDWYQVKSTDYTRSGYDRGHMTPSADRTATVEDNSSTFLMTNIVPQTPKNNRGAWKDLEEYCRDLVDEGKELYIVAGVSGEREQIGKNKQVTPPDYTWKVIVVLDQPGQGVRGVSTDTRVIAVDVPNRKNTSSSWEKYRVSVDELETKTGYNFLNRVPESIQKEIESRVDNL